MQPLLGTLLIVLLISNTLEGAEEHICYAPSPPHFHSAVIDPGDSNLQSSLPTAVLTEPAEHSHHRCCWHSSGLLLLTLEEAAPLRVGIGLSIQGTAQHGKNSCQ